MVEDVAEARKGTSWKVVSVAVVGTDQTHSGWGERVGRRVPKRSVWVGGHGGGNSSQEGDRDGAYRQGGEFRVAGIAGLGKGGVWAKPEKVWKGLLGSATELTFWGMELAFSVEPFNVPGAPVLHALGGGGIAGGQVAGRWR